MPERPILILPAPETASRAKKGGGGAGPPPQTAQRQRERLGERLAQLEVAFANRQVVARPGMDGAEPEDVLVLETAGTMEEFANAVRRVPGFEFLGEFDEADVPPSEDFSAAEGGGGAYTGRVYLVFSNRAAFSELLRLWQLWQDGVAFPRGFSKWRDVFSLLRTIRTWNATDRLEEGGVLADWEERLSLGEDVIPCEIELWFRQEPTRRERAAAQVRALVGEAGGEIVREAVVEGVDYHGLLARLPAQTIRRIVNDQEQADVAILHLDAVQSFAAVGQSVEVFEGESEGDQGALTGPPPTGEPRVAVLDGMPMQNHSTLTGRLIVDDPDGVEATYPVRARVHGTAMASLVVWGDSGRGGAVPLPRPVYIRPILTATRHPTEPTEREIEAVADDVLLVDTVFRAVQRLFEGPAVAKTVRVINLSIGIRTRPFVGRMSALARVLDWLAHKHRVLFIVSAGNHRVQIPLTQPWATAEALAARVLSDAALAERMRESRKRRILSPSEAMNVVTVGALQLDRSASGFRSPYLIDRVEAGDPAPYSANGPGVRRSIKPEIVVAGGRQTYLRPTVSTETVLTPSRALNALGLKAAHPGDGRGSVSETARTQGTSNAAALVSRQAGWYCEVVDELRERDESGVLSSVPDAVVVKTLVAHTATWGEAASRIYAALHSIASADEVSRFTQRVLGFGEVALDDMLDGSASRVTVLSGGVLGDGQGAIHRIPLPASLSGLRGGRALSVSLGWFTPVNSKSHRWRRAHLWFEKPQSKLRLDRIGPDWQSTQRGTLQHEVFLGESASVVEESDSVEVRVSCRADAPGLDEGVPYAICVTLRVAQELGLDIYVDVRERLRVIQQIRARL